LAGNAANVDTIVGGAGNDIITGDASAETQTITVATQADAAAVITVTIDGTVVTLAALAGNETAAAIAGLINTAINASTGLQAKGITSTVAGAVVTVNGGLTAGNIALTTVTETTTNATTYTVALTADGAQNTKGDILTGGAGNDVFHYGANAANTTVNVDTIIGLDLGTASAATDTFVFGNAGATGTVVVLSTAQQATVTASSTFANAVDNAFVAIAADGATGLFTYAGETYLLHNGDGGASYTATADYVIKVTGVTGTLDTSDFTIA
jgi:hypothetical protein